MYEAMALFLLTQTHKNLNFENDNLRKKTMRQLLTLNILPLL